MDGLPGGVGTFISKNEILEDICKPEDIESPPDQGGVYNLFYNTSTVYVCSVVFDMCHITNLH